MAFPTTLDAQAEAQSGNLVPQIILVIDGAPNIFNAVEVLKIAQYGDEGLTYGDGTVYGGSVPVANQRDLISFQDGTTTRLRQKLEIDKGTGSSIQAMTLALVDKNEQLTELISPGFELSEILGKRCKVFFGFQNTVFPEDFIPIFRGSVGDLDSKAGIVKLQVLHPDKKSDSSIFQIGESELSAGIDGVVTTIPLVDSSAFLSPILGPDGTITESFKLYVRIDDEVIRYEGISGDDLITATRGEFSTVAAPHDAATSVESIYGLSGVAITDIALPLLLSGRNGPFQSDVVIGGFQQVTPILNVPNAVLFSSVDIVFEYNLQVGDYLTVSGATNGDNNFTNRKILSITEIETGSYVVVDGAAMVDESSTSAVADFRSQYDIWPEGLKLHNDECDIEEHLDLNSSFLSNVVYDFRLNEEINGREFLAEQVYNPMGAYSLPRKARASLGMHLPPLPTDLLPTLSAQNVTNGSKLGIKRSLAKNFFNGTVYKYDQDILDPDRFLKIDATVDGDSAARFGDDVGNVFLIIESKGLRSALNGELIAASATSRRLKKYKFGAESIPGMKLQLGTGWNLEVGDIVLVDIASLQITDIISGTRQGDSRLFQIDNKEIDIKTGEITVSVTDTNFDKDARYGMISPSSKIKSASSGTEFIIKKSFAARYGDNEFIKWIDFPNAAVIVRSADYSVVASSTIQSISGNTIKLNTDLGFTPSEDYILELDVYTAQVGLGSDNIKNLYTFMQDNLTFPDGKPQYFML